MSLAGRCACGLRLDLAAQDPDAHLACRGERRCVQCDTVKPLVAGFAAAGFGRRTTCKVCMRPKDAEYRRLQRRAHPDFAERENERIKKYRVYGPKTGIRKGPQPRNHPPEKACVVCKEVKPDAQFIISKGYRRAKCYDCWRKRQNELRRSYEAKDPRVKQMAAARALKSYYLRRDKAA